MIQNEEQGNVAVAVEDTTAILLREGERLAAAGKRVIPCQKKKPTLPHWNQEGPNPSIEDIKRWMDGGGFDGIGVVQGSVSGGEHTLDFESIAIFNSFTLEAERLDIPIPQPLCLVKTGKGYHLPFICQDLKVGFRPLLAGDADGKPLIELLGEKCYAVRAPSAHPSGNNYRLLNGDQSNLPILSLDQANRLIDICRSLDKRKAKPKAEPKECTPVVKLQPIKPINIKDSEYRYTAQDVRDSFNSQHRIEDLLRSAGYSQHKSGHWNHPSGSGADHNTISNGTHVTLLGSKDRNLSSIFGTSSSSGGKTFDCFDFWATVNNFSSQKEAIIAASKMMDMGGRKTDIAGGPSIPIPTKDIPIASPAVAVESKTKTKTKPEANSNNKKKRKSDLICFNTVEMVAIEWLWSDRIPRGNISMIYGEGGNAKSQIALSIASTITTGGVFPDGTASTMGDVIVVSGEDTLASTIIPRFVSTGGDTSRIFALPMITLYGEDGKPFQKAFSLSDLPHLEDELIDTPEAKLVIIDPVAAFMSGVDTHRDSDVRQILTPLQQLAEKYNVAILLIAHCNKAKGVKASSRVSGSAGFINAVRSAFLAAPDPNGDGNILAHVKSNLSKIQSTLNYQSVETYVSSNGKQFKTSKVEWLGESDTTADEAIAAADQVATPCDEAVEFLQLILKDGEPRNVKDILKSANLKGISQATMYRAADKLKLEKQRDGYQGAARWRMEKVITSQQSIFH